MESRAEPLAPPNVYSIQSNYCPVYLVQNILALLDVCVAYLPVCKLALEMRYMCGIDTLTIQRGSYCNS